MSSGHLADDVFRQVIANTPLVSIDLIVRDRSSSKVLLGLRNNRPAANYWFVPGGRIRKDESMALAFERLSMNELGIELCISDAPLLGVYEHHYSDSVFGKNLSTHYVVIAREVSVDPSSLILPPGQHQEFRWFDVDELLVEHRVHPYTKAYFTQ